MSSKKTGYLKGYLVAKRQKTGETGVIVKKLDGFNEPVEWKG